MLSLRRFHRDQRRLLPLALLAGCSVLGLIYVRSLQEPTAKPFHSRRVDSIDDRPGFASSEQQISAKQQASKQQSSENSRSPEASTSGDDGKLNVRLQPRPVRWPWEGVEGCSQYGIRFAERGTLPVVALSSYPGSGNTWTRYMLELASGVFTGSIYYDMGLYSIGYWGELSSPEEGTTIVQKVHDFGDSQVERFNRTAIVIVRNPYRAVLSFHNYLFGGHKGMAPSSNYLRKGWRTFVMKQVFEWSAHVQKWTEPGNRVLVVHYEHLKSDPVGQLRRMLKFLNWPIDEERLKCVQADQLGSVKRHRQHRPRVVTPFPAELRTMIDLSVRTTQNVLRRRHLPPLPVEEYEFFANSSRRAEILEDCGDAEPLTMCMDRIDRMNVRYHVKSWLETVRDRGRKVPLTGRGGSGADASSTRRQGGTKKRQGDATGGGGYATAREPLSAEEEGVVENLLKTVRESSNTPAPKGDDLLGRFSGLLTGTEKFHHAGETGKRAARSAGRCEGRSANETKRNDERDCEETAEVNKEETEKNESVNKDMEKEKKDKDVHKMKEKGQKKK